MEILHFCKIHFTFAKVLAKRHAQYKDKCNKFFNHFKLNLYVFE